MGQLIRAETPLPVRSERGRMVDPRLIALDQIVRERNDTGIRRAGLCSADEIPRECAVIRVERIDISAGKVSVVIVNILDPPARRLIVMRSRINDTVMIIIVREIIALLAVSSRESKAN